MDGGFDQWGRFVYLPADSEQRISYNPAADDVTWSAQATGFYEGKVEIFKGFEFVDPDASLSRKGSSNKPKVYGQCSKSKICDQARRAQLVRRCGIYSSRVRSKWTELPKISQFNPPASRGIAIPGRNSRKIINLPEAYSDSGSYQFPSFLPCGMLKKHKSPGTAFQCAHCRGRRPMG
jgi:hypothetical protein